MTYKQNAMPTLQMFVGDSSIANDVIAIETWSMDALDEFLRAKVAVRSDVALALDEETRDEL